MDKNIPNLLLSYTYFLDNVRKTSISVGYDSNLLLPIIVLIKKTNSFKIIELSTYIKIYELRDEINKYFNDTTPVSIQCKELSLKTSKQKGLIIRNRDGRFSINAEEWTRLYKWLPFLSAVINHQQRTTYLVVDYYESYLKQCVSENVMKLDQPPHTPYQISVDTINYSRLFFELPILCETKLLDDYFKNVVQESINTSIDQL